MANLKDLKEKCDEILKAELAAWLHDVGKCADAFLQPGGMGIKANQCPRRKHQKEPTHVNPHKAVLDIGSLRRLPYWNKLSNIGRCEREVEANHRTALWKTLQQKLKITLPTFSINFPLCVITIKELILWGRPFAVDKYNKFKAVFGDGPAYLAGVLGFSHRAAHMEKEDYADGGQAEGLTTPFGWFKIEFANLDKKLESLIKASHLFLTNRTEVLEIFKEKLSNAPGDTRRPINEVTLWDWSSIVAALYKAEIARCVLLDDQREPKDVKWHLLSIRTDGLGYMLSVSSIPDMLARKEILKSAWDNVKELLEETYPLGLEVYRDEDGAVFVVPDLDVLSLTNLVDNNKTLREYILEAFRRGTVKNDLSLAVNGEIVPALLLDKESWDGQTKLPPIGNEHLKDIPILKSDPEWVSQQWHNLPKQRKLCTVCGLRPQGPSQKAINRKICDVCEKRREDRAKEWATEKLHTTIWIDEVADENGRLALIVGKFELKHWLSGILVRSLAVREPNGQNGHTWKDVAKNPSFARLHRIWGTTKKFWEEVKDKVLSENVKEKEGRIFVKGNIKNGSLGPYHAYEIEIRGNRLAVLWVPPDEKDREENPLEFRGGFWVIENPEYFKNRFDIELQNELKRKETLEIWEPSEYGGERRRAAQFTVTEITFENSFKFIPVIPILAEPQVFMAIVPANKAFEVVKDIKTKYEREMGKVRNRLSFHIGVVFAHRKTPLRAIMDAGKRMLKQKWNENIWEVFEENKITTFGKVIKTDKDLDELVLELEYKKLFKESDNKKITSQFDKWHRIVLRQEVKLNNNNETTKDKKYRFVIWYVPAVMGDGETEDNWYPYVFLASSSEPASRKRYFKSINPWNSGHPWLVHVGELQPGDKIYFTPATFDFEFLDSNARRFEISYDENGKRMGSLTKPYLLDEIEILEKIWKFLAKNENGKSRLSSSQIYAIRDLIESKRDEWFENPKESFTDENFKGFCEDLFVNAQWRWGKPNESEIQWLADMAVRGYFTDSISLFHHVMKDKVSGEMQ